MCVISITEVEVVINNNWFLINPSYSLLLLLHFHSYHYHNRYMRYERTHTSLHILLVLQLFMNFCLLLTTAWSRAKKIIKNPLYIQWSIRVRGNLIRICGNPYFAGKLINGTGEYATLTHENRWQLWYESRSSMKYFT